MAISEVRGRARSNPELVTAVLSVVGYAVVASVFAGVLPIPSLADGTVILLGDAIAVVNSVALLSLLAGYRLIRRGDVRRHRAAMLTAFGLIMFFLVLYVLKVGGGFEKALVVESGHLFGGHPGPVRGVYLALLGVHLFLSVVSMPVVLYAVVLGLTHTPAELAGTAHPRVGRVAVAAWSVSLALGILVYLLLNHVYAWEPRHVGALLLLAGVPARRLASGQGPPRDRRRRRIDPGPDSDG